MSPLSFHAQRKVWLWFVMLHAATILLGAGSSAPKTMVVLGDSIAAGYGLDLDEAFPALLEKKMQEAGMNWRVVNGGVSGDTTAGGLRRIGWLLRQKADLLLIELGGNDGLRGLNPTETEKNLRGIITKAREKYPDLQIVLAGMQMPANMGAEYTEQFKKLFPRIAREEKCALIPFILENVGGIAELNQDDRIHPTAKGHQIIAETAWKTLEPLLKGEGAEGAEAGGI